MQRAPFASNGVVKEIRSNGIESDQPKQDADLNLVYRAKFLGNVVRKLREEGIKVGYHIFVALQDLHAVRTRSSLTHGERTGLPAGTSPGYHYSLHD